MCVCVSGLRVISALPESCLLQLLSDINTACLLLCRVSAALGPQCKQVPLFERRWTALYLDDNYSIGYCPLLEWEHEDWVFMVTVPQPQVKPPHWTPFTTSSLWDVKSGLPFSFFPKPRKCFFSDCKRLPRQHVGAPLRFFRWRAPCDLVDFKPSDRLCWHACRGDHNDKIRCYYSVKVL